MKNVLFFCCLFLSCMLSGQEYELNTQQSKINWQGAAAFSGYEVSGTLETASGSISMEEWDIEMASIAVDMKSLDCAYPKMVKHLKSADFFEVKKYPSASFAFKSTKTDGERMVVRGIIEIKRISKEIELPVQIKCTEKGIAITGELTLNRIDFGITYNSPTVFEQVKDQAIADEISIAIELVFDKK